MKEFMDKDFLLSTDTAKWLYHDVASKLPIIDYHCHISPKEIWEDRKFNNISEVWLGGDHYKWRLMRASGVDEREVTGESTAEEKFMAFAKTMPGIMGHPVYHWSHLELQRGFGIKEPLTPATAKAIYEKANEAMKEKSARKFMTDFNVKAICTTDDPIDSLEYHDLMKNDETFSVKVLPAYRPDKAVNVDKAGFADYIGKLGDVVGKKLESAEDVKDALLNRIDFFASKGCLCADHGLDAIVYEDVDMDVVNAAFAKGMKGEKPTVLEADTYKTYLLIACAKKYAELNWVMQLHFGCLRDNNKPMWKKLGPDTGYDAVNPASGVEKISPLLNSFVENDGLPKTILYSLNPIDNTAVVTQMQCFQGGGVAGKIQIGSAWWFNDSRNGMRSQLTDLAANGVLGQFVGMLTDSRSFLSYTRHEYFRRILCEWMGELVESGQYPNDKEYLTKIVEDICFNNTNNYFGFNI